MERAGTFIAGGAIGLVDNAGSARALPTLGAAIPLAPVFVRTDAVFVPGGRLGNVFVLGAKAETAFVATPRVGTVRPRAGNAGILGGPDGTLVCAGAICVNSRVAVSV